METFDDNAVNETGGSLIEMSHNAMNHDTMKEMIYEETVDEKEPALDELKENFAMEFQVVSRVCWHFAETFSDLLALNLAFLRGWLTETSYHLGPLMNESDSIKDELFEMNRLGFITYSSQPYKDEEKKLKQKPFVEGIIHKDKSDEMIKKLLSINPTMKIDLINIKEQNHSHHNFNEDKVILTEMYVEDHYEEITTNQFDAEYVDKMIQFITYRLSEPLVNYITENMDVITIIDDRPNDQMFKDILIALK